MNNSGSNQLPQYMSNLGFSQLIQPQVNPQEQGVQNIQTQTNYKELNERLTLENYNIWLKNQELCKLQSKEKTTSGHDTQPPQPEVNITGGTQPIQPQVNPLNTTISTPEGVQEGGIQEPQTDIPVTSTWTHEESSRIQRLEDNLKYLAMSRIVKPGKTSAYETLVDFLDGQGINPEKDNIFKLEKEQLQFKLNALTIKAMVNAKDMDVANKALELSKDEIAFLRRISEKKGLN